MPRVTDPDDPSRTFKDKLTMRVWKYAEARDLTVQEAKDRLARERLDDLNAEAEEATRPSEWTYRQYRETVELHADSILDELAEYPTDDLHRRISESLEGAQSAIYPGWALMTVLLSGKDPDMPDYGPGWRERLDLDAGPTWSKAVCEMAYVCLCSDVMEWLKRCPDCRGLGDYYPEDGREKVDCETCGGTGQRDLEALAEGGT